MKPLKVYTLGNLGVNRVKSPIHVQDGEFLSAQNGTVRPVQGQQALTKRDGMVVINAEAANGTLLSIYNIPLKSFGSSGSATVPSPYCSTVPAVPDGAWNRGAWSPELGKFVVIGSTETSVLVSTDGMNWTSHALANSFGASDVIWVADLSMFILVTGSASGTAAQQIQTSADGETWTERTAPSDRAWITLGYSPTLNLVVGFAGSGVATGMAMSSTDGVNWTSRDLPTLRSVKGVVWAESLDLFIACTETNGVTQNIYTSPDGITWTLRNTPVTGGWNAISWSDELERAVVVGGPPFPSLVKSIYSDDGINWFTGDLPENSSSTTGLAWSSEFGIFLTTPAFGEFAYYSANGVNWTQTGIGCAQDSVHGVVWSPELEQFLIIGIAPDASPVFEMIGVS